ncbi:MAG: hypothetical protein IKA48_01060 [Fibrobacter sp.]|nr:hypothetical protein [Fibrobacter sp.]
MEYIATYADTVGVKTLGAICGRRRVANFEDAFIRMGISSGVTMESIAEYLSGGREVPGEVSGLPSYRTVARRWKGIARAFREATGLDVRPGYHAGVAGDEVSGLFYRLDSGQLYVASPALRKARERFGDDFAVRVRYSLPDLG